MGNNQSNTRTINYKKIKITDKREFTESGENWLCKWTQYFVSFELDEPISYEDQRSRKICFVTGGKGESFTSKIAVDQVNIGDYLELNLDMINNKKEDHRFLSCDGVIRGLERRDSDGNFIRDTAEFLGEIGEARQRYADMAESTRFQNQVLQSQISYNLPPW